MITETQKAEIKNKRQMLQKKLAGTIRSKFNFQSTQKSYETADEEHPNKVNLRNQCEEKRKKIHQRKSNFKTEEEFFEQFEMGKKIGEGTNSVVKKCVSKESGETKAVKITRRKDEELMEDLKQSFKILASLNHENILTPIDFYVNEERMICYMVSEYCEFQDLHSYLTNKKEKDEGEIATILQKILLAVEYLQEQGICHRDIKPQNILYNPLTKELKLIDFELARKQKEGEEMDLWTKTGTLFYRAPEIIKGGYSYPADVWSVGIIAYEMLIGHLPFYKEYDSDTCQEICNKELKIDELNISFEAQNLLKKLLEKETEKRINPSQALLEDFFHGQHVKNLNSTFGDDDFDIEELRH